MSSDEGKNSVTVLEQLRYLSKCIEKKCVSLSDSSLSAISLEEQLTELCVKIRKNCEVFENTLCRSPSKEKNLDITTNLSNIIGEDKCKDLKNDEIDKFKVELERFTLEYFTKPRDPVFENLYDLFYSELERTNGDSTVNSNKSTVNSNKTHTSSVNTTIREIFGSDSEETNVDLNVDGKSPQKADVSDLLVEANQNPGVNGETSRANSQNGLVHSPDESVDADVHLKVQNIPVSDLSVEADQNPSVNGETSHANSQNGLVHSPDETVDVDVHPNVQNIPETGSRIHKEGEIENSPSDPDKLEGPKANADISSEDHTQPTDVDGLSCNPENLEEKEHDQIIDPSGAIEEKADDLEVEHNFENLSEVNNTSDANFEEESLPINPNVAVDPREISDKDQSEEPIENTENIDCLNIEPSKSTHGLEKKNTEETIVGADVSGENNANKNEFFSSLGLGKTDNYEKIRTIRDELLAIFAEVNSQDDENGFRKEDDCSQDSSSDSSVEEDRYSDSKVAAALKELDEESSDMESVSGTELDLLSFDVDTFFRDEDSDADEKCFALNEHKASIRAFVPKKCHVLLERRDLEKVQKELRNSQKSSEEPSTSQGENEDIPSKTKECLVQLERLEIFKESLVDSDNKSADEDAVINRLCHLANLENNNKKRRSSEEKEPKRKIKRKRRCVDLSGTDTTDLSGYSSVSEDEIKKERLFNDDDYNDNIPLDPNALLVEIVCHTIHDSDSDSTILSSEDEKERKRQRKKKDDNETVLIKQEGGRTEKQESWKDDPLLKGSLNVPSNKEKSNEDGTKKRRISFGSDTEYGQRKKIRTKTRRKYLDPNYSDSDSSDDFEDTFKGTDKRKQSEGDSDIEFVGSSTSNTNIINVDSDDETERKNSRRNIKSVLSTKRLTESTQKAAEEEEARVIRLEEQKHLRSSQESNDSEESTVILDVSSDGSKVVVDPNLSKKLFSHQIEGVKFMWDACYLSVDSLKTFRGTGCILAHNMGLGKTLQVVTLVHTLFNNPVTNTKHVLIVCPLSTVSGWKREFLKSLEVVQSKKDIKIMTVESKYDSKTKCFMVIKWRKDGGVLILGYEAFSRLTKDDNMLVREALVDPGPDLVVCDEGHLLKNGKTLRTKALMEIRTKRRIALTGTPLQNNLNEYYYMVQFVKPNLLGTKNEFNRQFINPIMNGQYEDSLEHDITLMKKRTHVLHRLLKNTVQRYEATELQKYLENMKDYALFIQLHPIQEKLYRTYIDTVKKKMDTNKDKSVTKKFKSFFVDYQILKYICSHPQLLQTMETQNAQQKKNAIKEKEVISEEQEVHEFEGVPQDWWKADCSDEIKTNLEFGTKLQVMMAIIEEAEKIGEKVLIFTSSLVELSSVEFFLKLRGTSQCSSWKSKRDYFRMDGTVPPSVRTNMCDMFNDESNKTLRVFLMSHKVGGLGLNLVAANRVILLGANFNPSLDSQSIYRAYRFGQNKMVYIYRLLSMGTMEEKIYHRCVTKLAIASRVVDKHQITRHYKNLDLDDLYNVEINLSLQKTTPAKPDDDILSSILLRFDCVHKYHQHQKLLENRPDEELNEEDQRKAWEEFNQMNEKEKNAAGANISALIRNEWNQLNIMKTSTPNTSFAPRINPATPNQYQRIFSNFLTNTAGLPPSKNGIQGNFLKKNVNSQATNMVIAQTNSSSASTNVAHHPPRLIPLKAVSTTNHARKEGETTILQNSNKGAKPKSTTIGPNPVLLAKFQHRKENLATATSSKTNWRSSSSDDFQKPGCSILKPTRWTDKSKNPQAPKSSTDDDVEVIDISGEGESASEEVRKIIQKQLEDLRKRDLTVTETTSSRNKGDSPPIIDIT